MIPFMVTFKNHPVPARRAFLRNRDIVYTNKETNDDRGGKEVFVLIVT